MTSTVLELMKLNLHAVFDERDDAARRKAIEQTYAPDVRFTDPEGTFVGWDALDARARELLERSPGWVFTEAGPMRQSGELGFGQWNFGPEGDDAAGARGVDIALVREGRIVELHTILL